MGKHEVSRQAVTSLSLILISIHKIRLLRTWPAPDALEMLGEIKKTVELADPNADAYTMANRVGEFRTTTKNQMEVSERRGDLAAVANENVVFYKYLLGLPGITFVRGGRNTIRVAAALWAVLGFGTPWHRRPRCR